MVGYEQAALLVGLPETAITSTRDHQVRIQFPWQRGPNPNPGGLTETGSSAHPDGHAPGDDTTGTWVRVAEWRAGPNWGSHALPRIGSEVLVEFLHGDIDQPVITGQLYNNRVTPPFALADASNHPGTLSGLHTRSLEDGGSQQWVIDDAPGQVRQRLHSSVADSRLEMGYLIDHDVRRRHGLRGSGFDLATLGWANVRAGQGLLLSTTARSQGVSTQMDITEAVGQFKGAERTAQALDDALSASQIAPMKANEQQTEMRIAVDPEEDGKYPGPVNGQPATKPTGDQRHGGDPVERLGTPLLFMESPDAIVLATPKSALAHAGANIHLTSQQDAHLVAGQTMGGVAGGQLALFAQRGPIKAIAADGPISLQAHAGKMEVLADKSVTITATDNRIDVLAKDKIVLQAGQTKVTLEGANITFACPGTFTVKAGQVPFKGGAKGTAQIARLPTGLKAKVAADHLAASTTGATGTGDSASDAKPGAAPQLFAELEELPLDSAEFRYAYHDGEPVVGANYAARFADGTTRTGTLDDEGHAYFDGVKPGTIEITVDCDERPFQQFKLPATLDEELELWMKA